MKKNKIAAVLLTALCAVTLLFPAAWAAEAVVKASSVVQKKDVVELTYDLNNTVFAKASGISDEIRSQVRKAGRKGDAQTTVAVNTRRDAQKMLGVSYVHSDVFDAMQKPEDAVNYAENIVIDFTPTLKIQQTDYYQHRQQGGTYLTLQAMTLWDEKPREENTCLYGQNGGASYTETTYTAPDGRSYQIYTIKDAAGQVLAQYTMFQYGHTNYALWENNTDGVQRDLMFSVLDSMVFPG